MNKEMDQMKEEQEAKRRNAITQKRPMQKWREIVAKHFLTKSLE